MLMLMRHAAIAADDAFRCRAPLPRHAIRDAITLFSAAAALRHAMMLLLLRAPRLMPAARCAPAIFDATPCQSATPWRVMSASARARYAMPC
jgi:hypothetical protein